MTQDFGPKINFKKHKVAAEGFTGLPSFSQPLVDRLQQVPGLTVGLRYDPGHGAQSLPSALS